MAKAKTITIDNLQSLNQDSKSIVWKDLGTFLDKKIIIEPSESTSNLPKLNSIVKYKICKTCNRPIGVQSLENHIKICKMRPKKNSSNSTYLNEDDVPLRKRKNKVEVEQSSVDSSRNNTPAPPTPNAKPKKKYKKSQTQKEKEAANAAAAAAAAANGSDRGPKKKKLPSKTKQVGKTKGPVDVEKQCGVALPNGGFCARSLTCKTHSMGAKRAVPGRSAPYDVLLQQYQKRNQAKIAANSALAIQKKENEQLNGENEFSSSRILDPDEETYLVLEGLSKNQPIPLERKVILPTRNRHRFLYMREAYSNALIINGSSSSNNQANNQSNDQTLANQAISGSIGGLQGRTALVNVDSKRIENDALTQSLANISGEMYQVRAPSKEILVTAQHNAAQQQMFQQQIMKMRQQEMLKQKDLQKRAIPVKDK